MPLLTVAIPTYKRSETLEKIIIQLQEEKNQDFILLISDDSMDDKTEVMVQKYKKIMPNLIYKKNKNNLGFSANVAHLYDLGMTRYMWFLCDDDSVIPNAIENIIKALNKYEPVVAVFNAVWTDSFGRERTAGVHKDVIRKNIKNFNNYDPLMRTTFLSIVVVEKRLSIDSLKKKAYKDNIFFQVTLSLVLLSDKFKFCEIASPIVKRNVGYKYGEFFKFYLVDHLKAVTLIEHGFDYKKFEEWSVRQIPIALQLYLSQKMGIFKYNGRPTKKTILNIIKFYKLYCLFVPTFVVLYYLTPSSLIKTLYRFKLWNIHGQKKGNEIYKKNINRAKTDTRITGFITYR